jgi:proteasome lid subunit RPN8/RPN11
MSKTVPFREAQKLFGPEVLAASQKHAEAEYPKESVGFVVDNKYIALKNIHSDPENFFKVSPKVIAKYKGKIQAVIHSHIIDNIPGTNKTKHLMFPSKDDMETQIAWNVPFGIQYITKDGAGNILWWGRGVPVADYEGRPYVYGVYDCFSVILDYYRTELGIDLPDFAREDEWWERDDDVYVRHMKDYGMVEVPFKDLQVNDVILLTIRSKVANHAILYLGGDQGLHHLALGTSRIESINKYVDRQRPFFHSVWRYKGNPE